MGAKDVAINWQIRVSPDLDKMAQQCADSMGLPKTEFIRFIVANHCAQVDRVHAQVAVMLKDLASEIVVKQEKTQEELCRG